MAKTFTETELLEQIGKYNIPLNDADLQGGEETIVKALMNYFKTNNAILYKAVKDQEGSDAEIVASLLESLSKQGGSSIKTDPLDGGSSGPEKSLSTVPGDAASKKTPVKVTDATEALYSKLDSSVRKNIDTAVDKRWDAWVRNSKDGAIEKFLLDSEVAKHVISAKTFVNETEGYADKLVTNYSKRLVDTEENKKAFNDIIAKLRAGQAFAILEPKITSQKVTGLQVKLPGTKESMIWPYKEIPAKLLVNCGGKLSGNPGASATQVVKKVNKNDPSIDLGEARTLTLKLPGKADALKNPSMVAYTAQAMSAEEATKEFGSATKTHPVRSQESFKILTDEKTERTVRVAGRISVPHFKRTPEYISAGIPAVSVTGTVTALGANQEDRKNIIQLLGAAAQSTNAGESLREALSLSIDEARAPKADTANY